MLTLQRAKYDSATQQAYKSNDFTEFYKSLYLDRYMDTNQEIVRVKRKRVDALRSELAYSQSLLDRNTSEQVIFRCQAFNKKMHGQVPEAMMEASLNFLLLDPDPASQDLVPQLIEASDRLKQQIKKTREQIQHLEHEIRQVYSDMMGTEYRLHAVFMHEGEASYGHYWIYMWDNATQRWFKYNDSVVSQVSESLVFENTRGRNTNVYALAYIQQETQTSLCVRTDEARGRYILSQGDTRAH